MKHASVPAVFLMLLPLLLGMGSSPGSASPDAFPVPVKKFTAQFIDQADVVTECSEVSIEGMTFLEGKRGKGTFSLSFEIIDQIQFRLNNNRLTGLVTLRDGTTTEMTLNGKQKVYGRTAYGIFHIDLIDLKKVKIVPGPVGVEKNKRAGAFRLESSRP